jgi:uncharacterized protein (DUF2062 family)
MVFRRRKKLGLLQRLRGLVFPRGGWRRAATYLRHRLTRIPDAPHRVARGIACGIFASFTPIFGLHFIFAAVLAWLVRGNIIASLIGTAVGNPLTFPLIAVLSLDLGRTIMDTGDGIPFTQIMTSFGLAGDEIIRNIKAIFTADVMQWTQLGRFMRGVFLPYLLGGSVLGLVAAIVGYWLSLPALHGYQKLRNLRREARAQKKAARAEAEALATRDQKDSGS